MSLFSLCFLNETLTVIWNLKPLILSKKFSNKYLMLDLLASNWAKGYFESII